MTAADIFDAYQDRVSANRSPQGPDRDAIAEDLASESGLTKAEVDEIITGYLIGVGAG
ncbi:hypothetical protein [Ponticoccus litoralis]|uniref:Uncharacterized protein n=1 Tax=Ponticoccus litoralis TaxID=422297 RepID=A0AAW9SEV9_9RHOB